VGGIVLWRLCGPGILEERRVPLVGVAANEAVKVFEPKPGGPEVKGASLAALPVRDIVVLAVPGGVVAVLPQHLADAAAALGHQGIVAGIAGAHLHDYPGGAGMMVPPGDQGRPGG